MISSWKVIRLVKHNFPLVNPFRLLSITLFMGLEMVLGVGCSIAILGFKVRLISL